MSRPQPISVGTPCTLQYLYRSPAVEAVEGRHPLAPLQQIHGRTSIVCAVLGMGCCRRIIRRVL
jgi:hypothetical protein